jgi:hypothetical protein
MTMEQINQMHIARYEEENSYFPTIWYQQRMSEVEK